MQGSFSGEQMMGCAPPLAPGVCASCDKAGLDCQATSLGIPQEELQNLHIESTWGWGNGGNLPWEGRFAGQDKIKTIKAALVKCGE